MTVRDFMKIHSPNENEIHIGTQFETAPSVDSLLDMNILSVYEDDHFFFIEV